MGDGGERGGKDGWQLVTRAKRQAVQCENGPDWVVVHYQKSSSSFWCPILSQSALPSLGCYKSCKNNTNYRSEECFLAVRWRGSSEIKDKTKSIKASSHKGLMSRWLFFCFWISKGFFTGLSWSTIVIIIRHTSHVVCPAFIGFLLNRIMSQRCLSGQSCKPGGSQLFVTEGTLLAVKNFLKMTLKTWQNMGNFELGRARISPHSTHFASDLSITVCH